MMDALSAHYWGSARAAGEAWTRGATNLSAFCASLRDDVAPGSGHLASTHGSLPPTYPHDAGPSTGAARAPLCFPSHSPIAAPTASTHEIRAKARGFLARF